MLKLLHALSTSLPLPPQKKNKKKSTNTICLKGVLLVLFYCDYAVLALKGHSDS